MATPPFAYVNQQPSMRTPAGRGGMTLGDAILRLGDAYHLKDVQETLFANLEKRVPVHVIDAQGRFITRHIVPRVWDPSAPASLLGCQMSNVVPPSHPALMGAAHNGDSNGHSRACRAAEPAEASWAAKPQPKAAVRLDSMDSSHGGPSASCWPRCTLAFASLVHLALTLVLFAAPLAGVSTGARLTELYSLERASVQCSASLHPSPRW